MKSLKQIKWDLLVKKYSQVGDALGKGIDSGILETVVALNALGINTRQSCEGHMKYGVASPWVDVENSDQKKIKLGLDEAEKVYRMAEELEKTKGIRDPEVRKLYDKYHDIRNKVVIINLRVVKKLMGLLEGFYCERFVAFDRGLYIRTFGDGGGRLSSKGEVIQAVRSRGLKLIKLREYQEEMKDFTQFLRDRYFGEDTK
jgi:hypothetical protein